MDNRTLEPPTWLELESVRPLSEAEQITSLDRDTLLTTYRHLCVKVSPRRWGMKLKNCLAIADGTALTF
jgi:hypothetical protein